MKASLVILGSVLLAAKALAHTTEIKCETTESAANYVSITVGDRKPETSHIEPVMFISYGRSAEETEPQYFSNYGTLATRSFIGPYTANFPEGNFNSINSLTLHITQQPVLATLASGSIAYEGIKGEIQYMLVGQNFDIRQPVECKAKAGMSF